MRKTLFTLSILIAVVWLSSCGVQSNDHPGTQPPETHVEAGATGLEAFEQTLYPVLQTRCVECHGNGTGPQFAVLNVQSAYTVALPYANFSNVNGSRFVQKVKDGHCGSSVCTTDGTEMAGLITAWWNGGEDPSLHASPTPMPTGAAINLPNMPVPTNLPLSSTGTYTTLTWDLAFVTGLSGCRFTIEMQRFDADAYRFRRPRIITPAGKAVLVREIRFTLNGNYSEQNNAYLGVDIIAPAAMTTTLSPNVLLALRDGDTDQISFQFTVLQLSQ